MRLLTFLSPTPPTLDTCLSLQAAHLQSAKTCLRYQQQACLFVRDPTRSPVGKPRIFSTPTGNQRMHSQCMRQSDSNFAGGRIPVKHMTHIRKMKVLSCNLLSFPAPARQRITSMAGIFPFIEELNPCKGLAFKSPYQLL